MLCDTDRKIGLAYGAADKADEVYARRIAYLIGEDGKIVEAYPKVDPAKYPFEQLEKL